MACVTGPGLAALGENAYIAVPERARVPAPEFRFVDHWLVCCLLAPTTFR